MSRPQPSNSTAKKQLTNPTKCVLTFQLREQQQAIVIQFELFLNFQKSLHSASVNDGHCQTIQN
jgi:hypothetical protein